MKALLLLMVLAGMCFAQVDPFSPFDPPAPAASTTTCIEFDGINDMIDTFSVVTGTTFSFSAWIFPIPSSDDYGSVLTQGASIGLFYRGGLTKLDWYSAGDSLNASTLTENAWHHITVSFTAGVGIFYLDGSADGAAATAAVTFSTMGNDSASESFKGRLAQVAVYSIALSAAQAASLANKSTTPNAIGSLLAYWRLDDVANGASGNGVTFVDSSGNSHPGTGTGTTGRTATF